MVINQATQHRFEKVMVANITRASLGYMAGRLINVAVPGIVNPLNALVYSVFYATVESRLYPYVGVGLDDKHARIIRQIASGVVTLGICHLVGNPVSITAALALAAFSLALNKIYSGQF